MIEAERHRIIKKLVDEHSIISVSDLVDIVGASEATIRRDIGSMAERGELIRIRGGAQSVLPRHEAHLVGSPFKLSQELAAPEKRAIGRAAAKLIEPGQSIIISGGTTTYALVEFLPREGLDILTNSIPIITQLLGTSRNRVTVPGGTIYREQNIVLSPFEDDATNHYTARTLFAGCFGLNRFGVMETDPLIVQSQVRLLRRCEQLVIMADYHKLRQRSSIVVAGIERITVLVTDQQTPDEELEWLRSAGVRVIRAEVETSDMQLDSR
ncbi:MAG: DeoR/GlpR family DNA-binding transcription regulator [Pseudomonadota bacterium]|jgi:DeoR family ulaG and ulaABCDEF operon transcriptional repressor|nr:DeoR/GlpR family DNA-binding transcription regulator [Pseudomonadota bacterium]